MVEAWAELPPALWQWEHRTGFKDYDPDTCERIEAAYRRGDPYVRIKAGKTRSTPMELFFVDMIQHDPITGNQRSIRRSRPDRWHEYLHRKWAELVHSLETGKKYRMRFSHYMLARREVLADLEEHEYTESDMYKDSGWCAAVARHPAFRFATMLAVVLNSLWLGVDANFNKAATIWQADVGFQLVEHTFSLIFTAELAFRIGALRLKRYVFQDGWLIFDIVLVGIMVGENLVMLPIFFALGDNVKSVAFGDVSILRLARLLRLTRLTRVARLLRTAPEVLTLLKAITTALRSVFMTAMLLLVLLYVFGIVFKMQADSFPGISLFPTVGESMWTLLLYGTFLDAVADAFTELRDNSTTLTLLFLIFIFLSNLTILNMLVGILCEVVTSVDRREKEQWAISYLKHNLLDILEVHDKNNDRHICKGDFELLMHNPEMCRILQNFGVDPSDLLSLQEILFESSMSVLDKAAGDPQDSVPAEVSKDVSFYAAGTKRLRFAEVLEVVLRLRGGNGASVRDVVDLREYLRQRINHLEKQLLKPAVRAAGDEAPLRTAAKAGSDSSPCPCCSLCRAEGRDIVVGQLLAQIQEVRGNLGTMQEKIQWLEGLLQDLGRVPLTIGVRQDSDADDLSKPDH